MKLIKSSWEILSQKPGLEGIYEAIERAGRTCYKSIRKEGTTAKDFVDRMIASKHYAMLEHGTVYLKITAKDVWAGFGDNWVLDTYGSNPYSSVGEHYGDYFVTTNYRVLVEHGWLDDLKFLCEPTEFHEKRITVRFISNIHFYKDLTRHRTMSYAIESTRYCNYSKNKFENQLTFIIPDWVSNKDELIINENRFETFDELCEQFGNDYGTFLYGLKTCEDNYLSLLKLGWTPQQAAEILPQATKADIVCTGFVSDWDYIFKLRTSIIAATGKPHPELSRLMDPLYNEFKDRKLI